MSRRLACLSIPDFPMQIFLFERPEWRDEAVVLLDRDEANGRILTANSRAAGRGLGAGMLYGPCLGIHRDLKAGVLNPGQLADWKERVEALLFHFSPVVEPSGFRDGVWWIEASGLSALFSSVRPWLEELRNKVRALGLDCSAAAGNGRFSTWAAALLSTAGSVSLFSGREAEEAWFDQVPVSLFSAKAESRRLLERLKISTMGDLLKIPLPDIRRRLDGEMAEIVEFILRDSRLPLQGINPPESLEWSFPLEDPILSAGSLSYAADRLIGRCCEHARRVGKHVRSIRFFLEGTAAHQELVLRPSLPTRDVNLLSRLFASRLEYISLDDPVRNLSCTGSLAGALTPQGTLFGGETRGRWFEAQKVLSSLQAERGEEFVQYARVLENPLPMRRFELCNWKGFCERPAARSAGRRESSHPVSSGFFLSRRIVLEPKSFRKGIRTISRVAYSGGWWDQPYSYEMAWAESGGRTCWLSADSGRRPWKLIGWLD